MINWTVTRYNIFLNVNLDWIKYQANPIVLPPKELGKCNNWRFEIASDKKSAIFRASWDKRRLIDLPYESILTKKLGNTCNFA